jgi:crotonobetainyl-CoA:carnitine CoA-transferase CaiB-like acyl-CoA transferase
MPGPLEGIRIVELAQMIAVPGATHLLATQGATSIKVEGVERGDDLRAYGSQKGGMGGWFVNANGGKRSIGLNLQSDAGKAVMWQLLDEADVFIQGFRPGAVERLGFGPEEALRRNPKLVYVSSSGFGSSGPYADQPVYDPVIQALSGWAGAQATDDGPTLIRGMVADKVAALTASQAITAALVSRGRTGVGQHVEMSMLEANIAFNWPDVMMHCTVLDDDATHVPNLLGHYQLFRASDGSVSVTAGNDAQWQAVCAALDRPDLAVDERFANAASRNGNFRAWYGAFGEMCSAFTTEELLRRCRDADVPAVPALDPADVAADEQVVARDAVPVVQHPVVGAVRMPRQGARFESDGETALSPAPLHGQHTDEILGELGHDTATITALRSDGVVG